MKSLFRTLVVTLAVWLSAMPVWAGTCAGKFVNPITDICWSCMFPFTIGSSAILKGGRSGEKGEIDAAIAKLNPAGPWVVKAQVHAGGRGKAVQKLAKQVGISLDDKEAGTVVKLTGA